MFRMPDEKDVIYDMMHRAMPNQSKAYIKSFRYTNPKFYYYYFSDADTGYLTPAVCDLTAYVNVFEI